MNRPQLFLLVLAVSWKPYPLSKCVSTAPINDQNLSNLFEKEFFPLWSPTIEHKKVEKNIRVCIGLVSEALPWVV